MRTQPIVNASFRLISNYTHFLMQLFWNLNLIDTHKKKIQKLDF